MNLRLIYLPPFKNFNFNILITPNLHKICHKKICGFDHKNKIKNKIKYEKIKMVSIYQTN